MYFRGGRTLFRSYPVLAGKCLLSPLARLSLRLRRRSTSVTASPASTGGDNSNGSSRRRGSNGDSAPRASAQSACGPAKSLARANTDPVTSHIMARNRRRAATPLHSIHRIPFFHFHFADSMCNRFLLEMRFPLSRSSSFFSLVFRGRRKLLPAAASAAFAPSALGSLAAQSQRTFLTSFGSFGESD